MPALFRDDSRCRGYISLNYLILVGDIGILSQLYERVVVPCEVFAELMDAGTPRAVREWAARYPGWIEIRKARGSDAALILFAPARSNEESESVAF